MRISIAMATYNGSRYIREQLESLSNQTFLPLELVICDDVSTDDTLFIVSEYAKTAPFPVRIYQNEKNLGFADNFLHVASLCKGDWIGFCDQDDVWIPHKLYTLKTAIESQGSDQLMLVAHSAFLVGQDLKPTGRKLPNFRKMRIVGRNEHYGFWVLPGFACVFKRSLVKEFDWTERPRNYYPGHHWQSHDKWICMLANALGDCLYVPEPLAYYRRHEEAATGAYNKSSAKERIEKSKLVGADHYQFLSNVAKQSSTILDRQSSVIEKQDWHLNLKYGAGKFRELAIVCELRADIYKSKKQMQRLWRMSCLFAKGGYIGNKFYSFGVLSFLKDLYYCFFNKDKQ